MKLVPLFMSATAAGITALTMSTQVDVSQASSPPTDDPLKNLVETSLENMESALALDNGNFISYHDVQLPLIGDEFKNYCERHPDNCSSQTEEYGMIQEPELLSAIDEVNRRVNSEIVPADDDIIHGVPEYWTAAVVMDDTNPTAKAGDCEDYVITKIEELQKVGIPADAMSIIIVDPHIEGSNNLHAVLAVRTGQGDLILDNLNNDTKYLHETGYTPIQGTTFFNHSEWQGISLTDFGVSATIGDKYETYQAEQAEMTEPSADPSFVMPLPRPKGR